MKLFKSIDEKLADIGFVRNDEDGICIYRRKDDKYGYIQEVVLMHKASGRHILQSYDPELGDDKGIGNTCVGLTGYEMKLFLKKMKQLNLYSGRRARK